jgi:hypothetical protein
MVENVICSVDGGHDKITPVAARDAVMKKTSCCMSECNVVY